MSDAVARLDALYPGLSALVKRAVEMGVLAGVEWARSAKAGEPLDPRALAQYAYEQLDRPGPSIYGDGGHA